MTYLKSSQLPTTGSHPPLFSSSPDNISQLLLLLTASHRVSRRAFHRIGRADQHTMFSLRFLITLRKWKRKSSFFTCQRLFANRVFNNLMEINGRMILYHQPSRDKKRTQTTEDLWHAFLKPNSHLRRKCLHKILISQALERIALPSHRVLTAGPHCLQSNAKLRLGCEAFSPQRRLCHVTRISVSADVDDLTRI